MAPPAPIPHVARTEREDILPSLIAIHNLLHLTHHRNKNQHRLAKWWKQLSILRRNVAKLRADLEAQRIVHAVPVRAAIVGKGGSKPKSLKEKISQNEKHFKASREAAASASQRIELRVEFVDEVIIPKCYSAFSQLMADNQFAPLGLMLMGVLAKCQKTIRTMRPLRKERRTGGKGGSNEETPGPDSAGDPTTTPSTLRLIDVDFGEMIERSESRHTIESETSKAENRFNVEKEIELKDEVKAKNEIKTKNKPEAGSAREGKDLIKSTANRKDSQKGVGELHLTKNPKKKKRKKGDVFDDLFGNLT